MKHYMRKGHKLLLGLAILLLGLQMSCGPASGQEPDGGRVAAPQTIESAAETADTEKVTDGRLLQEEADKTEGALPDTGETEEAALTESSDDELLGRPQKGADISEEGSYTGKEEVSLYLHLYNHLPDNYITKREAKNLGWDSSQGNLWDVAPGKSIGGDRFGNYEGLLPEEEDREYFECDIDYEGGRRNAKRIVYSDDGLIFYTEDHYGSFEQLYGSE